MNRMNFNGELGLADTEDVATSVSDNSRYGTGGLWIWATTTIVVVCAVTALFAGGGERNLNLK